jgi:transcription antitermination factor NusG
MNEDAIGWNVLRTRSRHEKFVEQLLVQRQIPVYLPKMLRLSGRKTIEAPLFPGYVFVKPQAAHMHSMNFIPGTCGLIMEFGKPGKVQEREISSIRKIVNSNLAYDWHSGLMPGVLVRVSKGPLAGVVGELIRFKNDKRLVINAAVLGQSVSVEINAFDVAPA